MKLRLPRAFAALVALSVLAGCAALQFTYNNANSLVRYMAWDYFEPDSEQSDALQRRVAQLHEWHRANELPAYAAFADDAARRFSKGASREDVRWAMDTLRRTYRRMAAKAAEEAAPLLVTLRPEQIEVLEKKLQKEDAKYTRDWLSGSASRRERRAVERMVDRFEDWTGDLSRAQRGRIEEFIRANRQMPEVRLADRRRWQRLAVEHIRQYRKSEELGPRLARLFSEPDGARGAEYAAANARWESGLTDLLLDIDKSLSAEQRTRVLRRVHRYAEDFRALSQGRSANAPAGAGSGS